MNLNIMHIERKLYTVFDMLSDWGGFNGILLTFFAMISAIWNHLSFENFMVSRLFKIKKPEKEIEGFSKYYNKSEYIMLGRFPYFKECLLSIIPKGCCILCRSSEYCKRTRRELAM